VKVLIAHQQDGARRRLREVLERDGCAVVETDDAPEALEACRHAAADVALVDVELCCPERSLLADLKGDPRAYRTAVVLLGPRDLSPGRARDGLEHGADDLLLEPYVPAEVSARVRAAGRTKDLQETLVDQSRRFETLLFEDPLTGVSNRRYLLRQLDRLVANARRHDHALSALMLDIDRFKELNDEHGHSAGDRVLAGVAAAVRGRLRAEDHVGRLGGDEFLALLPDAGADAAATAADGLRRSVAAAGLSATVSIGWATWAGEDAERLLERADAALYAAKAAGRDRACGAR
jgi:diguanylate cyclase (GGDEF)-like protein